MKAIYTLLAGIIILLSACENHHKTPEAGMVNEGASLPADFNFSKMGLKVISSTINKKLGTMSTLYGNRHALETALAGTNSPDSGEIFALITWKQKADDRWFGAKIPGEIESVEVLKTHLQANAVALNYKRFNGKSLTLTHDTVHQQARISYILAQQPSVMP